MTRAYVPTRMIKQAYKDTYLKLPPELQKCVPAEPDENPVLEMAARLIRFLLPRFIDFHEMLREGLDFNLATYCTHPMYLDRDTGEVVVMTGLPLPEMWYDARPFGAMLSVYSPKFSEYMKNITTVMSEHPKRFETMARALSAFTKRERMPFTRAVSRYRRPVRNAYDPKALIELDEGFKELVTGFTLTYCETPQDYIGMYESGLSSCMVLNGGNARNWQWMPATGINPPSHYAYHPYVKGVYVKRKGAVVARALVYDIPDMGKFYGRIYSANKGVHQRFVMSLANAGYSKPIYDKEDFRSRKFVAATYTIPGRKLPTKDVYFMPLPYFDNLGFGMKVTWNKDDKSFTVEWKATPNEGNVNLQGTEGFITSEIGSVKTCSQCGAAVNPPTGATSLEGVHFCSTRCMRAGNHVMARRSDNLSVCVPRSEHHPISIDGVLYTNMEARSLNCYMLGMYLGTVPEYNSLYAAGLAGFEYVRCGAWSVKYSPTTADTSPLIRHMYARDSHQLVMKQIKFLTKLLEHTILSPVVTTVKEIRLPSEDEMGQQLVLPYTRAALAAELTKMPHHSHTSIAPQVVLQSINRLQKLEGAWMPVPTRTVVASIYIRTVAKLEIQTLGE